MNSFRPNIIITFQAIVIFQISKKFCVFPFVTFYAFWYFQHILTFLLFVYVNENFIWSLCKFRYLHSTVQTLHYLLRQEIFCLKFDTFLSLALFSFQLFYLPFSVFVVNQIAKWNYRIVHIAKSNNGFCMIIEWTVTSFCLNSCYKNKIWICFQYN